MKIKVGDLVTPVEFVGSFGVELFSSASAIDVYSKLNGMLEQKDVALVIMIDRKNARAFVTGPRGSGWALISFVTQVNSLYSFNGFIVFNTRI